jgi:hypothetical protein
MRLCKRLGEAGACDSNDPTGGRSDLENQLFFLILFFRFHASLCELPAFAVPGYGGHDGEHSG